MSVLVKKVSLKTREGLLEWLSRHPGTQALDPAVAAGPTHVIHSVQEVLKAFEQGNNIARTPEMELLVRVSGERQVSKAIQKAGVKADKAVFVCWSEDPEKTWQEFRQEFVLEEEEFRDPDKKSLLKAMEETAIFWMRA